MKILIADKFPDAGRTELASAGFEVVYEPVLKDDSLAAAIKSSEADILVVRGTKVTGDPGPGPPPGLARPSAAGGPCRPWHLGVSPGARWSRPGGEDARMRTRRHAGARLREHPVDHVREVRDVRHPAVALAPLLAAAHDADHRVVDAAPVDAGPRDAVRICILSRALDREPSGSHPMARNLTTAT